MASFLQQTLMQPLVSSWSGFSQQVGLWRDRLLWSCQPSVCLRCQQRFQLALPVTHCPACLQVEGFCPTQPATTPTERTHSVWEWSLPRYYQMLRYKRHQHRQPVALWQDFLTLTFFQLQQDWGLSPEQADQVAVVPMPRHDPALTNHLNPLGQSLCARTGAHWWPEGLSRTIAIPARKTLSLKQRRHQALESLQTAERLPRSAVRYLVVLDDIRTTGATQQAAQQVLRRTHGDVCSILGLTILQIPSPRARNDSQGFLLS